MLERITPRSPSPLAWLPAPKGPQSASSSVTFAPDQPGRSAPRRWKCRSRSSSRLWPSCPHTPQCVGAGVGEYECLAWGAKFVFRSGNFGRPSGLLQPREAAAWEELERERKRKTNRKPKTETETKAKQTPKNNNNNNNSPELSSALNSRSSAPLSPFLPFPFP